MEPLCRLKILVKGQVQGVGFRPHVYRIAHRTQLTGFVQNNASGVLIEIQGVQQSISHFLHLLRSELPALAKIETFSTHSLPLCQQEHEFRILESKRGKKIKTILPPDVTVCDACLRELFDPKSRYYLYPFLNCTQCGPRLTVTFNLPYDRSQTAMKDFVFCAACKKDYLDPNNRRYHAQPTACEQCGPQLSMPIAEVAKQIVAGKIIAMKGLGGYQLICAASQERTVKALRKRKHRDAKPFALMALNMASARRIVKINKQAEKLLTSQERPIVLLPKKKNNLANSIAPDLSHFGVMLAYTPLHYLLFHALCGSPSEIDWLSKAHATILIVTSANIAGNPLVIDDDAAKNELASIADCIVSYNRAIVTRVDDSVLQIMDGQPLFVRRARSYIPQSIQLPHSIPCTLAVGGHLKNTICITRDDEAFVSQHIGSMNNKATIDFFHETLNHFLSFLDVKPERIAHDLHPDFYTTRFAQAHGLPTYAVQHHHAHLAAVAAECHLEEVTLGLALDGYGYGTDGGSWGGELFLLDGTKFQRLGHFKPLPQIGGDVASREPWRMAVAILHFLGMTKQIKQQFGHQGNVQALCELLDKNISITWTSSCGRLFDAVSALLNITYRSQYEGHAAMMLESFVTEPTVVAHGWKITDQHFDMFPTIARLINVDAVLGANMFHGTLIAGLTEWVYQWAQKLNVSKVLLSGGCFHNQVLSRGLSKNLSKLKITAILPRLLPPNDGGLSLGQAWIAGRR